jgi:hypothetical protein
MGVDKVLPDKGFKFQYLSFSTVAGFSGNVRILSE